MMENFNPVIMAKKAETEALEKKKKVFMDALNKKLIKMTGKTITMEQANKIRQAGLSSDVALTDDLEQAAASFIENGTIDNKNKKSSNNESGKTDAQAWQAAEKATGYERFPGEGEETNEKTAEGDKTEGKTDAQAWQAAEKATGYERFPGEGEETNEKTAAGDKEVAPNETKEKEKTANPEQEKIDKEKTRKERAGKIATLTADMEAARKEYAVADNKKNTALSRIRKYFSNKGETERTRAQYDTNRNKDEQDQDLAYLRAIYDNKLRDLNKLKLEDAAERDVTAKELAELNAGFEKEEFLLELEHDNVKIEDQANTFKGAIGQKMVEISKSYQKLHWTKKIAIAGICFGAGALAAPASLLGAGILAGTTAGVGIGGLLTVRRLFSGATAGVGIALGLEARGQNKKQKEIEKRKEENTKILENMSKEERYAFLNGNAEKAAMDQNNVINKIKDQDIKQMAAGVAVGTFIGSGMMADLVKWGFHGVAEHFGWGGGEHVPENAPAVEIDHHTPVLESLNVEKGSSFEGTLIQYLDAHREEFLENHPEMAKFDTGQIAHRLAIDFMHAHPEMEGHLPEYIHAGAKLDFNPMSMQIEINDPQGYGWYETVNVPDDNISEVGTPETPPEIPPENLSEAEAHPQISQNIEEIKSQIGQFKEQLQYRGDLIKEIHSTQSEYDKLFEKSVNDDEFTRMSKAFDEKRLGEKLIELKKELLVTDENLGKMHEDLKNAHESIINNKTSVNMMDGETRIGVGNGDTSLHQVETQHTAGNIHVTEDISKTHGNLTEAGNISGHFDSAHPLELKSGTVSFAYNEHGGIIGVNGTHLPPESLRGVTGRELLTDSFDEKMQGHPTNGIIMTDKQMVGSLKIYNELLGQGHRVEAKAVLKHIYDTMDLAEKSNGVKGIFDRSKLPKL